MLDERAGILGTKRLEGVTNRGLAVDATSVQDGELEASQRGVISGAGWALMGRIEFHKRL